MRITQRAADEVRGVFTTPAGQETFRYDAVGMIIYLDEQSVPINEYGWEVGQEAIKSEV